MLVSPETLFLTCGIPVDAKHKNNGKRDFEPQWLLSVLVNASLSYSSAVIHPLLDAGNSSDYPVLRILSRTNPILPDNGCNVVDPSLL